MNEEYKKVWKDPDYINESRYYDFVTKSQIDNLYALDDNQILEQMNIITIEKFLRKKKLERLKSE